MDKKSLSDKLDRLIEFKNNEAPETGSWNPFKAHRQQKALQKWVNERPPGAGITGEDLEKQYPGHPGRTKHLIGATAGGVLGATGGILGAAKLATKLGHDPRGLINIGATVGASLGGATGWFASDPKHFIEQHKQHKADIGQFRKSFKEDSVPVAGLKSHAPIATSHMQVANELKKQNVGFLKRHAAGLATFPIRHSNNAAFVPTGDKGVIVSGKNIPKIVIAHEGGHAKDYAHYGGEAGFKTAYSKYGQPTFDKKTYIHNTLLPEHRAWAHANPRSKKDRDLKDAALRTYARGGFLLNQILDDLIEFRVPPLKGVKPGSIGKSPLGLAVRKNKLAKKLKPKKDVQGSIPGDGGGCAMLSTKLDILIFNDPRPRNNLGEFSPQTEGVADPNSMAKTYTQPVKKAAGYGGAAIAGGALGAIGGTAGKDVYGAVKNLLSKARKPKV